ncbi:MAG: VanZ family protein [Kiritimatiellae bacterium]|nr:VanZ family protein [Kiritimatiellia bacterium]
MREALRQVNTSVWWTAFICFTLILAYALLAAPVPDPNVLPRMPHLDKVAHFVLFGVQAALLVLALNPKCDCSLRPVGAALVCTGYGLLLEIMQMHVPVSPRVFSLWDLAADALGAMVFALWIARFIIGGKKGQRDTSTCCSETRE